MALESVELGLYATIIILLLVVLKKLLDSQRMDLGPLLSSNTTMTNDYNTMKETLGNLNTTLTQARSENTKIQEFSRQLSDILVRPTIRGVIGEKLLEDMCRQHLPDHLWERQKVTDEEADSERGGVDVLIKYGKVTLPVDSKFPREAWKRYIDTAGESMAEMSEADTQTHNRAIKRDFEMFQSAVRTAVNGEQGVTKHIKPPNTTEFGLMFIPNEAMYYALVSDKNAVNQENTITSKGKKLHLLDWMISENVIPVSPSIFIPFLEVIKLGLSNLALAENLEGLQRQLGLFEVKKGTYTASHDKVGEMLRKALVGWEKEDKLFTALGKKADDVIDALSNVEMGGAPEPESEPEPENEGSDDTENQDEEE
jgi:DNA recombination protein RmuC